MRVVVFFITVTIFLSSCGIARSTSSINNAKSHRDRALYRIENVYDGEQTIEIDDFGNKVLHRNAADNIFPLERRRAAYFFFKADAYLAKAYEFRSRSRYDDAKYLAVKAEEFYLESLKILENEQLSPSIPVQVPPEKTALPEKITETVEKPIEKPIEKPAEKPAEKQVEKPIEKPIEKQVEKPAEKPTSLKGDPFAKEKEVEKPEPAKEEKQPSYYDVYEEMRQKYLKKQEDKKDKDEKKDDSKKDSQGGAK